MRLNTKLVGLLCLIVLFIGACVEHDLDRPNNTDPTDCTAQAEISYATQIAPIITENCAISGCHNGGTGLPDWTKQANLAAKGSEVQRRITLPASDPQHMPKIGSLTDTEIQTIYCWIAQGAKNN
jgi:uncharacterized membrane protein